MDDRRGDGPEISREELIERVGAVLDAAILEMRDELRFCNEDHGTALDDALVDPIIRTLLLERAMLLGNG